MKKQTGKQKGFSALGAIVVIGLVVAAVTLALSAQKAGMSPLVQNIPVIQNANDLTVVSADLDKSDLGAFDKELNQLDADASTF